MVSFLIPRYSAISVTDNHLSAIAYPFQKGSLWKLCGTINNIKLLMSSVLISMK